ncbi:MAG TPA: SdrD B-like domain-containing protein [Chitinophagaceae bacterium]|mgnify:CR=1 FL=1|nr:MAG: Cna B domain-containing protein [Bacteroidetes bacterium OLB11]HMN33596.1 SdrD B-like domain-containing protein [Chitinophagaceae bacterium]
MKKKTTLFKKTLSMALLFIALAISQKSYSQGNGATITVQESRCVATGVITASGAQGVGPFMYDFVSYPAEYAYTGPSNSNVITSLNPGNYTLRIADQGAGGYTDYSVVVPGNYVEPTYNPITTNVTNCQNGSNGTISGTLIDGRAPFSYEIIAGPMGVGTINNTGTFTGLQAGTYSVRGFDSCGNFQTRQVTIANFTFSVSNIQVTKTACGEYSLNSLTISQPSLSHFSYKIRNTNNVVLATGNTLPIAFSYPDANIGNVRVCVVDSCGTDVCNSFTVNDWSITSAVTQYVACDSFTTQSVTINGSPIGPLTYGFVRAVGDTVWAAGAPPYGFHFPTPHAGFWGFSVVKDACGVIKRNPSSNYEAYMRMHGRISNVVYTSCSTTNLTVEAQYSYIPPVSFSLNGGAPVTNGNNSYTFDNLTDNNYTITMTDACGNTYTVYGDISHNWNLQVTYDKMCEDGKFSARVGVNRRMKSPVTYERWNADYSIKLGDLTYISGSIYNASYGANALYTTLPFGSLDPNTTYHYIATDDCGRTDTVTITTGADGHQPNTMSVSVTPLCISKGNITISYNSDNPTSNAVRIGIRNINNNTFSTVTRPDAVGTYTWTNRNAGTYQIMMKNDNCSDTIFQTVTIQEYDLPKLRKSIAFNCAGGNLQIIGAVRGGLAPYTYEVFETFPTNNPQPPQSSNVFVISGNYTLIRLRVVDACGNTSLQDVAVRPPAQPKILLDKQLPVCNLTDFTMSVDTSLPNQVYEWKNPAGTVIGTSYSVSLNSITLADTGTYSVRVTIPGTCYDKTATFKLRGKDFDCIAQLGNYVWLDENKNGIQDANEVGVAGITVSLYDNSNNLISATVTDAYGKYLFNKLAPGNYHVGFTLPTNYVFTSKDQGGNDELDSDPDPVTGMTGNYVLAISDSNMTVDAGIYFVQPVEASLGDYVWNDLNKDGIQDANELGISGVTVTLYDVNGLPVATTVTDATGHYLFDKLTPGTYSVGFSQPIGYVFSPKNQGGNNATDSDVDPITGMTSPVTIVAGENNLTIDAGLYLQNANTASLGNFVWNDVNNNGIQDANEVGVPGVTVTLYANDGITVVSTTTTNEFGYYIFNNLTPDSYIVGFSGLPTGFSFVSNNQGGDDELDSNPDPVTGKSAVVTLKPGDKNMSVDAGIHNPTLPIGALGDFVWYDHNNNGIQDANENGVPGVTVTLYDDMNNILATTATDARGFYLFDNLAAGNYRVGFSNIPNGYVFTKVNEGSDLTDSDANQATGLTGVITLGSGEVNLTVDAGIKESIGLFGTATLGDRVWDDVNNNGIQDENEIGVSGVTVTLYAADGVTVIATQITDPLGNYLFTGLNEGSYVVGFSNLPAGYTFSDANQGADDTKDGDVDATTGGKTGIIGLREGEDNLTIDAGIHQAAGLASLGNFVWFDLNQDGIQDEGEPGVPGVSVTLYSSAGTKLATTTTNAAGLYQFTGLTPGSYYVEFTNLPAGYEFTFKGAGGDSALDSDADPNTGETEWVTLVSGQNYPDLDAGIFTERAGLGNFVWNDLDGDGIQDAGENGIPGVTVILYASDGITPISSAITDANGFYTFINLEPGTYAVGFSNIPEGAIFSSRHQGANSALDSDPDPITGKTQLVTLVSGEYNPTIDAGVYIPQGAGLGDYVWFDANNDGVQDANESGVPGVTVTLYNGNGIAIKSAVTDGRGYYSFPNLTPGTYSVGFSTLPANMAFTSSNVGNDSLDNDVVTIVNNPNGNGLPVSGKTLPITLVKGEYNPTIDAGLKIQFPLGVAGIKLYATLSGSTAKVDWVTTNEENVSYFEIERSIDNKNFIKVAAKTAVGNTNGDYNYTLNDNVSTLLKLDAIYYRIKAIDMDGQYVYSNIASVSPLHSASDEVIIYPSPFQDDLTISYNASENSELSIEITDFSGKVVSRKSADVTIGQNNILINNLGNLAKGIYNIKVTDINTTQVYVRKVLKK